MNLRSTVGLRTPTFWEESHHNVEEAVKRQSGGRRLRATERKPFGILAEGPCLRTRLPAVASAKAGRGDWPNFERRPAAVRPFVAAFNASSEPHLLAAARLGREPVAAAEYE